MLTNRTSEKVKIGLNMPMSEATIKWIENRDPDLAKMIVENRRRRNLDNI